MLVLLIATALFGAGVKLALFRWALPLVVQHTNLAILLWAIPFVVCCVAMVCSDVSFLVVEVPEVRALLYRRVRCGCLPERNVSIAVSPSGARIFLVTCEPDPTRRHFLN